MRAKKLTPAELKKRARTVKLLILDVDGVLTDGGIIMDGGDKEYKKFNVRDGHGIKLLAKAGIQVAIITGRDSAVVARRARELGITEVHQRCHDKVSVYKGLLERLGVTENEAAYIGDDIVDIPVFVRTALPIAVSDAHEDAKRYALYVTKSAGGRGAVREAAEIILKAKGLWDAIIGAYSQV